MHIYKKFISCFTEIKVNIQIHLLYAVSCIANQEYTFLVSCIANQTRDFIKIIELGNDHAVQRKWDEKICTVDMFVWTSGFHNPVACTLILTCLWMSANKSLALSLIMGMKSNG